MGGAPAVNAVPIVGQPVAYGMGFVALVVLGTSTIVGGYFQTYAHEGGHMLAAFLLAHRVDSYRLFDYPARIRGITYTATSGITNLVVAFAGYVTPAVLGLGGAALIAAGNPWAVLVTVAILSGLALLVARNGLAFLIPALIVGGVIYVSVKGSASLQAATAVGVVWFLLISGLVRAVQLPSSGGDARNLASRTVLIPGFVWKLIWIAIAVVSLYAGGRLLLVPGA